MFPKLRSRSVRYRKKSLVVLAIICISSSAFLKVCVIAEKFYTKHYVLPEVEQFKRMASHPSHATIVISSPNNSSLLFINNLLTSSRIRHQLKQDLRTTKCSDYPCTDVLSASEKATYTVCSRSAQRRGPMEHEKCIFMNGTNRHPIGLASYPGSGNTWVRGLLQKVTGYCTGSLYCDRDLRRHGFAGEGITGPSVLVTKTHKPLPRTSSSATNSSFAKVILIIRDPFHAMISERNRQLLMNTKHKTHFLSSNHSSIHLGSVGQNHFGNDSDWMKYVNENIRQWMKMASYWMLTWGLSHPLYVVKYEDIVENTCQEVSKILRFIGIHVDQDDVRDKLQDGYSAYRRKSHGNFTHYTADQISMINSHLRQTQRHLESFGPSMKYNLSLDKYLKTCSI